MLKFIIFAVAAFFLYKMFIGDKKQKEKVEERSAEKDYKAGKMAKDPVCGTYVPIDSEIRVKNGDSVFHFCSYDCRDAYIRQIKGEQSGAQGAKAVDNDAETGDENKAE